MESKNRMPIRIFYVVGGFIFGFIMLLVASLGQAASMSTFVVNTTLDNDDGTCDMVHCSLREAINAANGVAGADTITFSLLPSSTITMASSQLPLITDILTIDGSTAVNLTISGNNLTRTFQIGNGTAVTIKTLIISDGIANYGGAIDVGGGGLLTISNTTFKSNSNTGFPGGWNGGGAIFTRGTLNISNSTFYSNSSAGNGGAIEYYCCFSQSTITNSTFMSNSAVYGGGAIEIGCCNVVNIIKSNFISNSTDGIGGGLLNSSVSTVYVDRSTFRNNHAVLDGGALNNRDLGEFFIINSTLSGNTADRYGGGIRNWGSGLLNILNSTISGNSANLGGGIFNWGLLNYANTIIANSAGGDCYTAVQTIGFNINNLVEDGGCESAFSGDPLLTSLQNNGGPTGTHALLSISPAVDNGDNATCAAPPVNNLDQRGVTRPFDGNGDGVLTCDIGAYEYDGPPPNRFFLPVFRRN